MSLGSGPCCVNLLSGEAEDRVAKGLHACMTDQNKLPGHQAQVGLPDWHMLSPILTGRSKCCLRDSSEREQLEVCIWFFRDSTTVLFSFADFNLYSVVVIIHYCDITAFLGPVSPFSKSPDLRVTLGMPDTVGEPNGICCTDPDLPNHDESVLWEKEG